MTFGTVVLLMRAVPFVDHSLDRRLLPRGHVQALCGRHRLILRAAQRHLVRISLSRVVSESNLAASQDPVMRAITTKRSPRHGSASCDEEKGL